IVVTGGSRGLGLATAEALAERGAKVAIFARSKDVIGKAVDVLGHQACSGFPVDVRDRSEVFKAFEMVEKQFGHIDGLVNNAGVGRPNKIDSLPEDELRLQIDTNFYGAVYCCQAAIAKLRLSGGGHIINISSASVHYEDEMAHCSVYSASKAALEIFSRELRHEVAKDGISVSVVVPGFTATEFSAGFSEQSLDVALKACDA